MEPTRITAGELKARLDKGEAVLLVDTRGAADWEKSRVKLPGAIRIHYSELEEHLPDLPRDRTIVTYCA